MAEEKDLSIYETTDAEENRVKESIHLTARESARITRENRRITNAIEKQRNRRNVDPSEYITEMVNPDNVVEFDDLHTYFFTDIGTVRAVDGVTFEIPRGKTVGVVGESGCGKSVTALSLMQLVQRPQGQAVKGAIRFDTGDKVYDIVKTPTQVMESIRGAEVSMIFQEPMTSLNPVFRAGDQIDEVIALHNPEMTKEEVKAQTIEMIDMVGIANKEGVYKMYPHELSGGMRQRIMIAMALACNPKLLIADEPTTALDVIIQAEILKLMNELKNDYNTSIMFITHDLGVISEMADDVIVMHRGKIVESGSLYSIFDYPTHPYTKRLMAAFLKTDISSRKDEQELEQDLFSEENEIFDFQNFRENNEADDDWYEVAPDHFVACRVL